MRIVLVCLLVALSVLSACKTADKPNAGFKHLSKDHKLIAVMPVEFVMDGKQPKRLGKEQIEKLQNAQGLALQQMLQMAIVNRIQLRKKPKIGVIDLENVNKKIRENGMSISAVTSADAGKIAKMVNADAVVTMKVTSTRYMSNLASYGIDVGTDILEVLKKFYGLKNLLNVPIINNVEIPDDENQHLNRTNQITVSIKIIQAKDGTVIWNELLNFDTNWDHSYEDEIRNAVEKAVMQFPYR